LRRSPSRLIYSLFGLQSFSHGRGNDFTHAFTQCRHIFFCQTSSLDGVVQINGNFCRPEHPMTGTVMLKRANEADGYDGNAELLRDAEAAVLKLIHAAIARPPGFGKDDKACAGINGVLREAPHALQVRRASNVRNGNVAEALHQPAVRGNFEVGFQLPATDKLRDGTVKQERIENIDVIRHEEVRPVGIETRRAASLDTRTRKKHDAAAEAALEPIVLAGVKKDSQKHEQREEYRARGTPESQLRHQS